MNIKFNETMTHVADMSYSLPSLQDVIKTSGQARGIYANSLAEELFGETVIRKETKGSDGVLVATGRRVEIRTVERTGKVFVGLACERGAGRKVDPNRFINDVPEKDYIFCRVGISGALIETNWLMLTGEHVLRICNPNNGAIAKDAINALFDLYSDASAI